MPQRPKHQPAPVPVMPKKESAFIKAASRIFSTTFIFVAGVVMLLLGILFKVQNISLGPLNQAIADHQWRVTYIFVGLGLLFIGQARTQVVSLYSEEARKNRASTHKWKIPLVVAQVVLLQVSGLYGALVGFHVIKEPVKNLLFFFFIGVVFLGYFFWYLIAHMQNRYQTLAGLRIAGVSLILATFSFFSWTIGQFVLLSLLAAFFSVLALLISITFVPLGKEEQRGNWLRALCLMGTVLLLIPIALAANPLNKIISTYVQLGPAAQNLSGQVDQLTYSPDSKKLAFTQKNDDGWFLGLLDPDAADKMIVKYQAGDDAFTPIFVERGSGIVVDLQKGSARNLYLLDVEKGTFKSLTHTGIEPLSGGVPWSETSKQFLYVTKTESGYQLNALPLSSGKSVKIFSSPNPILSPSWVSTGYQIAYVDGICERPYIYDQELKTSRKLFSDDEKAQIAAADGKLKIGYPAVEVIPSPDAFRYLFKCKKDDVTVLETALADGSKAYELYRSFQPIEHLAWMDLGQKIIFEEAGRQAMYLRPSKRIEIQDANLGSMETLIWPQIPHHSPAPSPDGVKVAFVGSSGLWYPSIGLQESSGIWVAVLR